MPIVIKQKGDFTKTQKFFEKCLHLYGLGVLDIYGREGVAALSAATPVRTGKTASSWTYKIVNRKGMTAVEWHNTNINDGVPIALIIQYGHGTGNGGYVQGIDYINPAIQPVFEHMALKLWREVIS